jgi:hypothetical protein
MPSGLAIFDSSGLISLGTLLGHYETYDGRSIYLDAFYLVMDTC